MNRGAWQAIVRGVTKSWTRLNTVLEQNQLLNLNKDFAICLLSLPIVGHGSMGLGSLAENSSFVFPQLILEHYSYWGHLYLNLFLLVKDPI